MDVHQKFIFAERQLNEGLIRCDEQAAIQRRERHEPSARMRCMHSFLSQLNHPQRGIPAVYVAGTSGKGSVSAAIAGILQRWQLKVGLHVSPYLQVPTEKIKINGRLISQAEFVDLVDWVMPVAQQFLNETTPASIHGMASVAIAFEAFRRAQVDVIVCEAGCGARFDLTNFLDTEVAVITNVGLDHLQGLGPTLEDIAWHKAGCATPGKPLLTGATGTALDIIRDEARTVGALLTEVPPQQNVFVQNDLLAQQAARALAQRMDIPVSADALREGARDLRLPGRLEPMPTPPQHPHVFLDGAPTAATLNAALPAQFAKAQHRHPVIAVVGFLGTKAAPELVRPFVDRVQHVIATEPTVYGKAPYPAHDTAKLFHDAGIPNEAIPSPNEALLRAISLAGSQGAVLVTGSFYLVGQLREQWYPRKTIAEAQTSWPEDNHIKTFGN